MNQTNAKPDFTLEIESLAYGPYGIGRIENKVVMVPATVPGDKISARLTDAKGNYAIAEMVRLLQPSPLRQTPPCPYVTDCGGCPWQHVRYEAQLKAKEQSGADALRRIGTLTGFELRPILRSPRAYHLRRRILLQCNEAKHVGLFRALSDIVVETDNCLNADHALHQPIHGLRTLINASETAVDHVEIVTGDDPDEVVPAAK